MIVALVIYNFLTTVTIIYLLGKVRAYKRNQATIIALHNVAISRLHQHITAPPQIHDYSQLGYTKINWGDGTSNWVWTSHQED